MSNNTVDITITYENEFGQVAAQRIYGVEILNAGTGMSVDDMVFEQQMTFIAKRVGRFTPITYAKNVLNSAGTAVHFNRQTGALGNWTADALKGSVNELTGVNQKVNTAVLPFGTGVLQ